MFKKPLWQTVWTQIRSVLGPRCLLLYLICQYARQLFAADNFSRQHFQMRFFLGVLRVNFLPLGKFLMLFCCQNQQSECQTDWIQIRTDILSGLIWNQSVCKGYEQTTLSVDFFQNQQSECPKNWIQISPDFLSGLIWEQLVCKGCEQTTLSVEFFFKINFLSVKKIGSRSGLISEQSFCKGYEQTTSRQ